MTNLDPNVDWAFVAKMQERFPGFMWVNHIPELQEVIVRATNEEWSPETFEANLRNTNWWKSTSESVRQWTALQHTDPAEANRRIEDMRVRVGQIAGELGVTDVAFHPANHLGFLALSQGWTEQRLRIAIADTFGVQPGAMTDAQALADAYMIDASDEQLTDWTRRLFTGELSETGLRTMMQQQAAARFPSLAQQIEAGLTPGDYFAPYKTMIARMTDQTEDQIDLMRDSTWRSILSHAGGDGQLRPMTLNEAEYHVRGTNQYLTSRTGQQEMAGFRTTFEQMLGARA